MDEFDRQQRAPADPLMAEYDALQKAKSSGGAPKPDTSTAGDPGYGERLATGVLEAARRVPVVGEPFLAAAGMAGSHLPGNTPMGYQESLHALRDQTGQMGTIPRMAAGAVGSSAAMLVPGLNAMSPAAFGATLGAAEPLTDTDANRTLGSRLSGAAVGAGVGAVAGKVAEGAVNVARAKFPSLRSSVQPSPAIPTAQTEPTVTAPDISPAPGTSAPQDFPHGPSSYQKLADYQRVQANRYPNGLPPNRPNMPARPPTADDDLEAALRASLRPTGADVPRGTPIEAPPVALDDPSIFEQGRANLARSQAADAANQARSNAGDQRAGILDRIGNAPMARVPHVGPVSLLRWMVGTAQPSQPLALTEAMRAAPQLRTLDQTLGDTGPSLYTRLGLSAISGGVPR